MPQFQFEVAVVLAATSLLSAIWLALSKPEEGKVKLPQFADGVAPLHDPFDVTKVEDIVDGEPIDEAGFWAKVRCCLCHRRRRY